ncbi:MAG: hypothetical protein JW864_18785 [Spirochaetes bacterium]|nr:hypothetical protein [Spirochaetota bacterium]
MQIVMKDFEKSAKRIFKLFFNSNIEIQNKSFENTSQWGVDLPIEFNGKKKFTLYLEENTLKGVIKHLTGNENLNNNPAIYDIIGEIAKMIAGNTIGDISDSYTMHHPVPVTNIKNAAKSAGFDSDFQEFSLSIQKL